MHLWVQSAADAWLCLTTWPGTVLGRHQRTQAPGLKGELAQLGGRPQRPAEWQVQVALCHVSHHNHHPPLLHSSSGSGSGQILQGCTN